MPATGTIEPIGLDWYLVIGYLKQIFTLKNVVGFDIVELAPIGSLTAGNFLNKVIGVFLKIVVILLLIIT